VIKTVKRLALLLGSLFCFYIPDTSVTADKLKYSEENNEVLWQSNQMLTAKYQQLQADLQQLTADQQLRRKIQQLRRENQNLDAENQQLRTENHNLDAENQQLRTENHNLDAENQQLRTANCSLIGEIQSLRRHIGPCLQGWLHFQSSCYMISSHNDSDQKTWQEAADDAELGIIESPEEQDFIYRITLAGFGTSGYWIGLRAEVGGWKWVDGSSPTHKLYYW
uniref:C-type lectin domain-containing protein n=1 Tax=Poecilia formosa TaxID=48698 RepID=A0A096MDU1_POEFO